MISLLISYFILILKFLEFDYLSKEVIKTTEVIITLTFVLADHVSLTKFNHFVSMLMGKTFSNNSPIKSIPGLSWHE